MKTNCRNGAHTAGDNNTSPLPTFLNNKINDIFIYKNRLGFCRMKR